MTLLNKARYIIIFSFIIIADQVSKIIVQASFGATPYKVVSVIDNFFFIRYVKNKGAVWGIFSQAANAWLPKLITGLSLVALLIVIYFFLKLEPQCKMELMAISFIIGGAIGNIIDRLYQGFVVDWLDFIIVDYHWPTFNIADMFISVGVGLLVISIWRGKCTQF